MGLRHLIVVIPGILGSTLETSDAVPVWGHNRRVLAGTLLAPQRLSVEEHPHLVPTGLLGSLTVAPPLPWAVDGYSELIDALRAAFAGIRIDTARPGHDPDQHADVLLFPYDFRLGVVAAAHRLHDTLAARLDPLTRDARARRVIVVAHSLGGLVARHWLGPLGGATDCRALLSLGTPHRGAPKALDWLVNGVRAGGLRLPGASQVLRGWASAYDLLPRYPAIWDTAADTAIYPHDLAPLAGAAFAARARDSYQLHLAIEAAWQQVAPTQLPDMLALFARGHATPAAAVLRSGQLRVSKVDSHWLPNPGWGGDGTVPALSAIPLELDDDRRSWLAVAQRHTQLPKAASIIDILRNYEAASLLPARRADAPDTPWLGLDVDDAVPAGEPAPIEAVLHGVEPPAAASMAVWTSVRDAGSGARVHQQRLSHVDDPSGAAAGGEEAAGAWRGILAGLAPGAYRVVVEAVGVAGVDRVTCADVLLAVAPP